MLIDSNILIYAINRRSPKHRRAKQFLKENLPYLEIAHQNILEAIRVLTHGKFSRPMKPDSALDSIFGLVQPCRVISPDTSAIYISKELIKMHQLSGNRIFDAYLAATALSNGIDTIATDNTQDFKKFSQLKIINPFPNHN